MFNINSITLILFTIIISNISYSQYNPRIKTIQGGNFHLSSLNKKQHLRDAEYTDDRDVFEYFLKTSDRKVGAFFLYDQNSISFKANITYLSIDPFYRIESTDTGRLWKFPQNRMQLTLSNPKSNFRPLYGGQIIFDKNTYYEVSNFSSEIVLMKKVKKSIGKIDFVNASNLRWQSPKLINSLGDFIDINIPFDFPTINMFYDLNDGSLRLFENRVSFPTEEIDCVDKGEIVIANKDKSPFEFNFNGIEFTVDSIEIGQVDFIFMKDSLKANFSCIKVHAKENQFKYNNKPVISGTIIDHMSLDSMVTIIPYSTNGIDGTNFKIYNLQLKAKDVQISKKGKYNVTNSNIALNIKFLSKTYIDAYVDLNDGNLLFENYDNPRDNMTITGNLAHLRFNMKGNINSPIGVGYSLINSVNLNLVKSFEIKGEDKVFSNCDQQPLVYNISAFTNDISLEIKLLDGELLYYGDIPECNGTLNTSEYQCSWDQRIDFEEEGWRKEKVVQIIGVFFPVQYFTTVYIPCQIMKHIGVPIHLGIDHAEIDIELERVCVSNESGKFKIGGGFIKNYRNDWFNVTLAIADPGYRFTSGIAREAYNVWYRTSAKQIEKELLTEFINLLFVTDLINKKLFDPCHEIRK